MVRRNMLRRTYTKQRNNKNSIKTVTIENHKAIISPNPSWKNSLLSLEDRISLSDFHEDVIFEILVRLPATSLHELRRVCKEWLHIISDPYFIHSHVDRVQFQPNVIERFTILNDHTPSLDVKDSELQKLAIGCKGKIRASCNGLLLVENKLSIHVSNPATKQLLTLPTCSAFPNDGRRPLRNSQFREYDFCRFGYAPSTREYKVLHFFLHRNQQQCEILTLGSNAWRRVPGWFRDLPLLINEQVMLNGVLHWVVGYHYIMSVNLAEETFHATPVPSCAMPPYPKSCVHQPFYLMEIGGYPSLMVRLSRLRFDVWILKDFQRKEWMRLYSIDGSEVGGLLIPIAGLRNDEVIFQREERKRGCLVLCTYNLRLQKMVEVRIYPGMVLSLANMTHFHSLVSWKIQSQSG